MELSLLYEFFFAGAIRSFSVSMETSKYLENPGYLIGERYCMESIRDSALNQSLMVIMKKYLVFCYFGDFYYFWGVLS